MRLLVEIKKESKMSICEISLGKDILRVSKKRHIHPEEY
jgi:hypothetical protein